MADRLEYNFLETHKFGDLSLEDRVRFLAPVMDIGLSRIETATITVGPMALTHFFFLSQVDPDAVIIWSPAEQTEFPYLVEHPGQVGEYKSYPLIVDAYLGEDSPIILNGVKEGTSLFINVDLTI